MLAFWTGATATWALWKVYDAWVDAAAVARTIANPGGGQELDPAKLAVALQDLDELETAPAQALRHIADAVRQDPRRFAEVVAEQMKTLSREQRAAVGIALVLAAQRLS